MLSSCTSLAIPKSVTLHVSSSPTNTLRAARSLWITLHKEKTFLLKTTFNETRDLHVRVTQLTLDDILGSESTIQWKVRYIEWQMRPYSIRTSFTHWYRWQIGHSICDLPSKFDQLLWGQICLWFDIRVFVVSIIQSTALSQVTQQIPKRNIFDQHKQWL